MLIMTGEETRGLLDEVGKQFRTIAIADIERKIGTVDDLVIVTV